MSGVPGAPALPCGVAAKRPRRLPAGGSTGPLGDTGWIPSAMRRPPETATLEPGTAGGGGTTAWPELPRAGRPLARVRSAPTGNCGAGATTCVRPMLRSPKRGMAVRSTSGAGSTTAGSGACSWRREEASFTSGGGATADTVKSGAPAFARECSVTAIGTASGVFGQATTLGRATSWFNFRLGGATMDCVGLSACGGTEMIGCAASSGSPRRGC